jgi:tetratricopeptide (TPR) repeat protein
LHFLFRDAKKRVMLRYFLVSLTVVAFASLGAAQTKTSPPPDTKGEAVLVEQYLTRVHFENDGTGFREVTFAARIQSEAGIQRYGQLVFGYNSATEKLDVNYVRVRKPSGEVIETPAANAQDFAPEVLESAPMYSDYRERHITVSGIRPGDLLEYQTTTKTFTPLAAGEFWFEYDFPDHMAVRQARLEIDVPKSREIKLKSPRHKYAMAETGDRRTYTWVVENITPDRKEKDDSDDQINDDSSEFPDVQLTTFKDWQAVAHWYAKLQGERVVIDEPVKKKAADLTRGATTQLEKAQRLYDFVARDIRYVSLSFGVGRYQPHAANEVLQGSYGDCKDKHTLLAALLQAAGIQSYPVLIHHGRKLDEDVPSPAQFDHVITAARIDKNLVWLDTTAEVAPFGLIIYPLRDKKAVLAASDANGGLVTTPDTAPVKNTLSYNIQAKVAENGALDSVVELTANGDSAVLFRIFFRGVAQADWPKIAKRLALLQGFRGDVSDVNVQALEQPAKNFVLRYKIHQDAYFNVPSSSVGYYAFPPLGFSELEKKKKGSDSLRLGPALEEHSKAHIEFPANFNLRLPPEVRITRDYGEYSLSYHLANNVLDAERTLIMKVSKLPVSRRNDVESLRNVARSYTEQSVTCDARPASKSAVAAASLAITGTPQELRKAAAKALQQRDFNTAAALLKQVVEKQPDSSEAWDDLGRAYAALNNHTEAIAAYRKQVEVNPFHKRAYDDLAFELQRAGKLDDALAAYSKQLENVPVDDTARKGHALLLAQLGRKEALPELENAASSTPDDAEIELALARAYAGAGNKDKSASILTSVIGSAAPPANGDLFAAALGENINPDETLRNAKKIVDAIGEQFDSGAYDQNSSEAATAMYFLALGWARIGWAKEVKGERLEAMRYLDSAWKLSQSGAVANRLARIYEKGADTARATQLLQWAVAAGGADVEDSKARLAKLTAGHKGAGSAPGPVLLEQLSTVKLPGLSRKSGRADFLLVFDGSDKPERAEFQEGDAELISAEQAVMDATYPVAFPDYSSVKIVRTASVSCSASGCTATLKPLDLTRISPLLQVAAN